MQIASKLNQVLWLSEFRERDLLFYGILQEWEPGMLYEKECSF